jgi:hypothetical protein
MTLDAFCNGGFVCSIGKSAFGGFGDATVDEVLEACLKAVPTAAFTSLLDTTERTTKGYRHHRG